MFGLRTEVNIEDPIQNCQKLPNKDVQLIKTTYPGLYCHCGQQEKLGGAQLSFWLVLNGGYLSENHDSSISIDVEKQETTFFTCTVALWALYQFQHFKFQYS